jgi:hypothetical protein
LTVSSDPPATGETAMAAIAAKAPVLPARSL